MYNMLFGGNVMADSLLEKIGLSKDDFRRYRDAWAEGNELHVLTRNGGVEHEEYEDEVYDRLSKHPNFLRLEISEYDNTYETYVFSLETPLDNLKNYDIM